jgi:hypothetical protein
MTPSQGRSGARLDYVKTAAVCGRCRSWQMTFCDTAGSRMSGGVGSALIDCHARQLATGKTLRDQEAPGSIALLHTCAARDDTSVPTVSARAPPAGQVAMHPTPDAIRHEQPLQRDSRNRPANASRPFRGTLTGRAACANRVGRCTGRSGHNDQLGHTQNRGTSPNRAADLARATTGGAESISTFGKRSLTGTRTGVGGSTLSLREGRIRCCLGRPVRRRQRGRQDGSHRARPVVPPRWSGQR